MNESQEQYVTLFCEGDGSVGVYGGLRRGNVRVGFVQKERGVLDYVASLTAGGKFYQHKDGTWKLEFHGSKCIPLFEVFSRHAVGSRFIARLNSALALAGLPCTTQHSLTLDGFVGFWDAEGSSTCVPQISVAQSDVEILDIIRGMFGGGIYPNGDCFLWYLGGEDARDLFSAILSRSHCSEKAERLRENFEGPSYYATHREAHLTRSRNYYRMHATERRIYGAKYYRAHMEARKVCMHKNYVQHSVRDRQIRKWIEEHPIEVTKIAEREMMQ